MANENSPQTQTKTPLKRPVMQYNQPEEKKERIPLWLGACMVIVAACIDAFEAILDVLLIGEVLSPVISVCADVGFWIWFKIRGVGFTKNPKNFATMGTQAIIGLIPGLDILPELTLGVLTIVLMTRSEDKGGLLSKAAGMASGNAGATTSRLSRISQAAQKFRSGGSTAPEQDYDSEHTDRKGLEKPQKDQQLLENKKTEAQRSSGGGESFKENDLIVPDDEVGRAGKILDENAIPHKDHKYTERRVVDVESGTVVPGEFVLTIFNPEYPDKPASFGFVKQVVILLRNSGIVVRYGKNPERG